MEKNQTVRISPATPERVPLFFQTPEEKIRNETSPDWLKNVTRDLRVKMPSGAIQELKRKHGNISAWMRGHVKAEVGMEHWPEECRLEALEPGQLEFQFLENVETENERLARTVGRYRLS